MASAFQNLVMLTQPALRVCQTRGRPWIHSNGMQRCCAPNSTPVHQPAELHVDIAEYQLEDLNARLKTTRWPDQLQVAANKGWEYGTELNYLQVAKLSPLPIEPISTLRLTGHSSGVFQGACKVLGDTI